MEEYYYKQLSKAEGGIYYAIYKGLLNLESEFLIPSCDNQTLYNIFFRLRLDHPEIFGLNLTNVSIIASPIIISLYQNISLARTR